MNNQQAARRESTVRAREKRQFRSDQELSAALSTSARHSRRLLPAALAVIVIVFVGCSSSNNPEFNAQESSPPTDPAKQIELLEFPNEKGRLMAAKNLGRMGAAAESAIPALEKVANNDPDEKVRKAAAEALEQIRSAANTTPEE